jgi:transposase InsO family protein
MLDKTVLVFLDDILVFSRTKEEHARHVGAVLQRLRDHKLYAKRSKCEFFRSEVEFLGHRIGANGLSVSQDKVQAVRDWPVPRNASDVRSFHGLANFYRKFVKDFSKIALPVTKLMSDHVPFEWGREQQTAFEALKAALCSAPVLLIPNPALPYTLNCDACKYAIGGTLQQDHGRGLQPVAYWSQKLSPAEQNYDTREQEFMALVMACSYWRHYLHSEQPFCLLSDHDSLKYHKTMEHMSGRLARWIEKMAEFDYTIEHIPGVKNVVADALSRRVDYKQQAADEADDATPPRFHPDPDEVNAAALGPLPVENRERAANRRAAEESHAPAPDRPTPTKHGAIVMPSQRCTADTAAGAHCRQRTRRGQFCWQHLSKLRGVRIKRSTIPGAGFGIFASRDLPPNTRLGYTGDKLRDLADDDGGAYFLELTKGTAIDAARTNTGEGRWVNDPRGTDKAANCEFTLHTPPGKPRQACVRTTRLVPKGEELLCKYGAAYWRFIAAKRKAAHDAPAGLGRKGRKRRERVSAAPAVAALRTTVASALTDALRSAAAADSEYQARLAKPLEIHSVRDGLLCQGKRVFVPNDTALRTRITAECHDSTTGAHFGRDKTTEAVRARFAWDGLTADVERYVLSCDACQRNKPSRQATPGLLMPLPLPDRPCQEWTTDAVTGLPPTKRGHDAIQVYVERLCKLKHFAAARKSDGAKEMAASFAHNVIRAHGVPEAIISDRDPRFTASFYEELTRLLGTELRMSTARHPQSDGQSEREIQTLILALRAFCNAHQDDWDEYLDMLELGFNCAVQTSTQRSPYAMLNGTEPRLPIDVALAPFEPRNPAALDRAERAIEALTYGRTCLLSAQERQAHNADRHRRAASFAVGDAVLLSTEGLQLKGHSNKLCSPYIGPFEVTAVVNANAYTLRLPPQLHALHPTFNIDKLKRYRDGRSLFPSRPQAYARPPPEAAADSNGDAVFVVSHIVAARRVGRAKQYLVMWKGYPPEEATWQPRSSLDGAREALAEFEQRERGAAHV